jgi:glutamine amidotransferase
MISIIDYGSGNIQAIGNIYKRLNIAFKVASSERDLESATKLILPGVGAFDKTMQQLMDSGLKSTLDEFVLAKGIPVLGICVGMQILAKRSDEGELSGLGWIDGEVKLLDFSYLASKPRVPHMGWNSVAPKGDPVILSGVNAALGFYFLHSYYFSCVKEENVLCRTNYGINFASAVNSGNIYGVQFHPEKSHGNGNQVLKNFADL